VYLDDVRLAVSAGQERAYIGKVAKDKIRFSGVKKDVTSDFIKSIIDMFGNSSCVIGPKDGQQYKLTLVKVEAKDVDKN